ncbi:serine hydrolase domain-containing protein [Streptosporangium jomthongense]|uniref:Serine hydrolase domain-containing protein n=1 Tax=Streptosporangium jomthongense TaxID=1193683 RepID=A0ABV8EZM8_9ACTN
MIVGLGLSAALVAGAALPAQAAGPPESGPVAPQGLDREGLEATLNAVRDAGMYGLYSSVRNGRQAWDGAAGVADVETGRPVRPGMRHRVGSITKTFTAVAILQQAGKGRLDLDAPVARHLPRLLPADLGRRVTVRMLLNHTSGIGDYVLGAFPSLAQGSAASLDEGRFRSIAPAELVRLGLQAQPTGEPGERWSYSNTNYVIAGLLLEAVTGEPAQRYITREVIHRAGLRETSFPRTPVIPGPHSKAYESLYGLIDPPRDYSVYDMSWAYTAGAVVSTTGDLDRFYRALLEGRLLPKAQLAQMQTTVPVTDGQGNVLVNYGLGVYAQDLPCGRFWGHDGGVFGMGTFSLSSQDGRRQISLGINLMKYQRLDAQGIPQQHPIDQALGDHMLRALCGPGAALARGTALVPFPTQQVLVKR